MELSAAFVNVSADQVDAQIEHTLMRMAEFLGVDRISLGEPSGDGLSIAVTHFYAAPGYPPVSLVFSRDRLPWITGKLLSGEVFRLPRMLDELPPEAERERQLVLLNGIKSVLLIPLKVGGHHLASIGFVSCRVYRDWPDDLVRRLRLAGEVLASALARKRSDEVVQQRESALRLAQDELRLLAGRLIQAQEQERRRIAREMHDDWTQRLAVLAIEAAKLEQQLGRPEEAVLLVQAMRESLVSLSEDVHSLSRQLHPAILDDLGLADALRSECAGTAEREGLVVSYRPVDVPATLPKDASLCLYRVAQEALRNVVKHAQTGEAWVTLGATGWEMVLCVEDRGAGFDVAATRSRAALGLSSMLERVRLVGGELEVESKPDRGTRVTVRVPLGGGAL